VQSRLSFVWYKCDVTSSHVHTGLGSLLYWKSTSLHYKVLKKVLVLRYSPALHTYMPGTHRLSWRQPSHTAVCQPTLTACVSRKPSLMVVSGEPCITGFSWTLGVCGWQKMTLVRFSVLQKTAVFGLMQFRFFGSFFVLCASVYCFITLFYHCSRYDARSDILPCWIVPTNCEPKWLRTRSAEIRHKEKILWLLILSSWKTNCEWDNVKNCPQTTEVGFLKTELWKLSFRFLNFEVGSVRFLQGVSVAASPVLANIGMSVCLSVRPSHAGTEWKRRKLGSRNLHRRIAQWL